MKIITLITSVYQTNTYIIVDNGLALVVDPGSDAERIIATIAENSAKLTGVLITHGHFDHIDAVYKLQKNGATVYMTEKDYGLIEFNNLSSVFGTHSDRFDLDVAIKDGDILDLIGHEFRVIETPGHTPGGVCFVLDDNTVFSGDTLFRLSVGRTDFPHGDSNALIMSVNRLFNFSKDCVVYPGHGSKTTIGYEIDNNPYVHF